MDKFDRIFDLHRYFSARHTPVTIDEIAVRLECNRSTAYRLLGVLRDQLEAPMRFRVWRGFPRRSAAASLKRLPPSTNRSPEAMYWGERGGHASRRALWRRCRARPLSRTESQCFREAPRKQAIATGN
jgi:hypothetical protein